MSVDLDSISKVTAFGAQALLVQWMLGTLLVLAVGLLLKGARSLNARHSARSLGSRSLGYRRTAADDARDSGGRSRPGRRCPPG